MNVTGRCTLLVIGNDADGHATIDDKYEGDRRYCLQQQIHNAMTEAEKLCRKHAYKSITFRLVMS